MQRASLLLPSQRMSRARDFLSSANLPSCATRAALCVPRHAWLLDTCIPFNIVCISFSEGAYFTACMDRRGVKQGMWLSGATWLIQWLWCLGSAGQSLSACSTRACKTRSWYRTWRTSCVHRWVTVLQVCCSQIVLYFLMGRSAQRESSCKDEWKS